jgi:transposase
MLQLVNSTVKDVSRKEDVGYDAVEGAIGRRIQANMNWDRFTELEIIGIDEIAMRKGHGNFVAIVTTQQSDGHLAILGVLADRQKETVRQVLEVVPKRLWSTMKKVFWRGCRRVMPML